MSILNVNQIQPVGSGQTVTISATNIDTGSATFTGSSSATFNNGLNVTGGSVGIGTDSPVSGVKLHLQDTSACRIQLSTDNTGHTSSDGVRLMIDSSNNFEILNRENASIEFFTNNTQRWSINSTGNLVAASSGLGIDFSAASGSAAGSSSAVLDDYEEGTWTPTLTNGYTYDTLTATYTKIGNVVFIYCNFYRNDSGTYSSDLEVTNLPFDMESSYTNSMGLGVADSYNGTSDRRHGHINYNNSNSVKVIKDGTTSFVSYDNFVVNSRNLTMKWWYYTA
jgi:hypothetical protein